MNAQDPGTPKRPASPSATSRTRLRDQAQIMMEDARIKRRPLKRIGGFLWNSEHEFTRFDFVMGVISIALYLADVGTDVRMAVLYFVDGDWVYGAVTTALVVVAYLVVMYMGWIYYMDNRAVTKAWWCFRIVFLVIGLSPIVLTIEYLYRGRKSRSSQSAKKNYTKAATGNSAVKMVESFLEAAPQLCFQLYVIFKDKPEHGISRATLRGFTVSSSWASLAVAALTYYKFTRVESEKEKKLEIPGQIFYFLWRVTETGGRVLCIALFASTFGFWAVGVICVHFLGVSAWKFCTTDNEGCPTPFAVLRSCLFGYVMVFYIPFYSTPSRYVFLVYYVIFYAENAIMLGLWAGMTSDDDAWFYVPGIVVVVVFFILHIVAQVVYYMLFHPNADSIKCCLPCNRQTCCVPVCGEGCCGKKPNRTTDNLLDDIKCNGSDQVALTATGDDNEGEASSQKMHPSPLLDGHQNSGYDTLDDSREGGTIPDDDLNDVSASESAFLEGFDDLPYIDEDV